MTLGSGAGFDCFLAAERVGPEGWVIGVDMTPEMLERARENAKKGGFGDVEFRLGEIEAMPVPDGVADIVVAGGGGAGLRGVDPRRGDRGGEAPFPMSYRN